MTYHQTMDQSVTEPAIPEKLSAQRLRADAAMHHLAYLDALRGIAVLGVVAVHSGIATKQTGQFASLTFAGQRGVQLFYIVSAFTLYRSLDLRQDGLRNFFVRRFFRIAPMFYLAILMNLGFQHMRLSVEAGGGTS